ncbi:MAG: class I SAM-dependent methyltransferase [Candidatus Paceibacterota bacterium]
MAQKTSWGAVAGWYDEMLTDSDDSYQKNVIMPNLIRLLEPKKGLRVLDLACGQGYFSRAFAQNGAQVIGTDISPELIDLAKRNSTTTTSSQESESGRNPPKPQTSSLEFKVSPADQLPFLEDGSIDAITIVLALQNIENLPGTLAECARVLKVGGRLLIILNHPAFRVPQNSSWQWDEENSKQYRRIDSYMSDKTLKIDMTPGEVNTHKKQFTVTFHRPLQSYFKALNKAGLSVTRLEEWISHKKSQKGPRAEEEDRIRKEIPMFVCLEAGKK